ncbi:MULTISPECIES: glycosyltransferase [Pseudomonas]|jgi:glycosyltransferase involved in cell wall biosynthesis|uniref:glycosyltransferase n=1 Tax=Pseudomonas TaxID=286 RepID=UPI00285B5D02|nr:MULTISPECIES: glycosyltransferase [Pseudomonas]MDR6927562.1 glycosyltransferase involved in cell wall biosynthesis [Pseudomonas sp. BE134]MDR7284487.1 glycosyltransferase involved in cell wall biosynthesis [Pseudomonas corrugata]
MSRISIVIPMYNEARHIARTLLAAQKAAHAANLECELIVVDNGSQDEGPQIARQFGAQVLVQPGILIGALRNRGTAVATGEWLAFIDADVEVPEDWLTQLIDIERTGQADVFGLDLHTPAQAPWYATAWQRRTLRPAAEGVRTVDWLPSSNLLMRRSWFDKVDGFNESLRTGEDKDFTLRQHMAGARLLAINESVALHWGYEMNWREWMGKEMWRQSSHVQLLRTHGLSLRLLRFPLLSLVAWLLDFLAISALLDGFPHHAAFMLSLTLLPALILSVRQSHKHRDQFLTLQLWGLHWVRLHLAGAALVLSLCHWNARRPARG